MVQSERLNIGILAHVDAGKTTLAESLLYICGMIRKSGRVDHGNAFLDTYALEKQRGITIFSKMAQLTWDNRSMTLVDTPGHEDFGAEMERTLQVLDCAILVISASDGLTGHDKTLWHLLERYQIPVFLFVNKMDQPGADREHLTARLKEELDGGVLPFDQADKDGFSDEWMEEAALCDEQVLEKYMETGEVTPDDCAGMIAGRKLFPCYFGSALKNEGVEDLLSGIGRYGPVRFYPDTFGARVFKICRGEDGRRETWLKVTGGKLYSRQLLQGEYSPSRRLYSQEGENTWEEKTDRLLLPSGAGERQIVQACAGTICVVTGLHYTFAGQGLGHETAALSPVLEPVLTYALHLPEGCDVYKTYRKLQQLEEEIPELHLKWQETLREIQVQIMGEVQIEILEKLIEQRFGLHASFGEGKILYKETILSACEGVGHFEPLRHYAEVHLILEPGERGSGLVFQSTVSTDDLKENWQRLILTHLQEKVHVGILTGSPITDMKITLSAGKAHLKHTEGGDFREATYRALRQGLMRAENELLEPYYDYRLELPLSCVGRAMHDLQRMSASIEGPVNREEVSVLTGTVPVSGIQHYQIQVSAYTGGRGRLSCSLAGYFPCHNRDEVIEQIGYNPETDPENTADSVFCSHGAGRVIPWHEVEGHMHLDRTLKVPEGAGIRTV